MDSKPESDQKESAAADDGVIDATQPDTPQQDKEAAPAEASSNPPAGEDDGVDSLDADVPEEKPVAVEEDAGPQKKPKAPKLKVKKNLYVILFAVLLLIAGGVTVFSIMTGAKKPPAVTIGNQALSQDALTKLANSDASVGSSAKTLTVQSNAIFSGQLLVRGSLTTAGNIQAGGAIQAAAITISGAANLGDTQVKKLQIAGDTQVQGATSVKDLTVAGVTSLNGPVNASQITVNKLIISGNGVLQVPNHLAFTGATPGRKVNNSALGAGGSGSIGGSDVTGSINLNTGSSPSAGCYIQITFNKPFASTPHVIVSPSSAPGGSLQYYVTRTTSGFNLCSANAPSAGSVYIFDYFVAS